MSDGKPPSPNPPAIFRDRRLRGRSGASTIAAMESTLLLRALSIAGCIEALARQLRVPKKQLGSWITGEVETPDGVYLRVVNFLRVAHK